MQYKIRNSSQSSVPTVFIHAFTGDGQDVWDACRAMQCPPFNLVTLYGFDPENDLTPWSADNIRKGAAPFGQGAMLHLQHILHEVIPEVETQLPAPSACLAMAGYLLAGLFTLWTACQTDRFARLACISASFWYPDFITYLQHTPFAGTPQGIYGSLGDRESKTHHPLLSQVDHCTHAVFQHIQSMRIPSVFELNPGTHFTRPDYRTARAIQWMLQQ